MEVPVEITCPFCGESYALLVDSSIASQRLTTDCEVCCRPLDVSVDCQPGEVLSIEVL